MTFSDFLTSYLLLLGDAEPIHINVSTNFLARFLSSKDAHLGTYPLALTHSEGIAHVMEFLTILRVCEGDASLMLILTSIVLATYVLHIEAQIHITMQSRLVIYLILIRGLESLQNLNLLRLTLVSTLAGNLLQLELVTHTTEHKG